MEIISLYKAEKNSILQIVSIPNVILLEHMGLRNGARIKICNRYIFGGPVVIQVEDTYVLAIGKDVAKHIQVIKL